MCRPIRGNVEVEAYRRVGLWLWKSRWARVERLPHTQASSQLANNVKASRLFASSQRQEEPFHVPSSVMAVRLPSASTVAVILALEPALSRNVMVLVPPPVDLPPNAAR